MKSSTGQSVGQILQNAREQLGISLADAANATAIKTVYLQELENDHPEKFASQVQARGFLRLYAKYLRLSYEDLIPLWDQPAGQTKETPAASSTAGEQPPEEEQAPPSVGSGSQTTGAPHKAQTQTEGQPLPGESAQAKRAYKLNDRIMGMVSSIRQWLKNIPHPEKLKKLQSGKLATEAVPLENAPVGVAPVSSQEVFRQIGSALRERRLLMQLNLSDIEQFTNIKRMYLEAIEDGRFSDLPSTVQGRGMLNIYAQFLAMDESAVMDSFAHALQIQREERLTPRRPPPQPPLTVRVNLPANVRRVLNPDLLVGGFLIVAIFAFIIWGVNLMLSRENKPIEEAPSISDVLQITPTATPAFEQAEITPSPGNNGGLLSENSPSSSGEIAPAEPTPVATLNTAPLQVYIIAHDRAYMKVEVDGREVFNSRTVPDNVYIYSGQNLIKLLTGNGAALETYFNQEYLGNLGDVGEVVRLEFSPKGLINPTPAVKPTP